MKKILLIGGLVLLLTGCQDEYEIRPGYNKAICNYGDEKKEIEIDKYIVYADGKIAITSGNDKYLISTNKCYLVKVG